MPGKPYQIELADLGGGLNESDPSSIADREAARLEGLYPVNGTSLWQTEGVVPLASAASATITAIARYNPSFSDEEYTILGMSGSIGRLKDGAIVPLSIADGRVYPGTDPIEDAIRASLRDTLVGYWPFDEQSGTRAARVKSLCDLGEVSGTVPTADGRFGRSVRGISGASSYLEGSFSSRNFNSGITIAAYVYLPDDEDPPAAPGGFVSLYNSSGSDWIYLCRYYDGDGVEFGMRSPSAVYTTACIPVLTRGVWHLLVAMVDPSRGVAEMQIDNGITYNTDFVPATSVSISGWSFDRMRVLRGIGGQVAPVGRLDAVAIFSSVLDQSQRDLLWNPSGPGQNRWWFRQYNDEMFACQKGNGSVKRIYGDSVVEAGISAPSLQPEIVDDGTPGQKAGGTYVLGYTFYNRFTGAESNISPFSKEAADVPAGRRLTCSNIGTSDSPQVNARRIYASLGDDQGTLYLVGQIDDNVTTTYIDNAKDPDDYGDAYESANGLPPSQAVCLETGMERLFVSDGQGLAWSEAKKPQSFRATSYKPISRQDGYDVTGLRWWEDHGLVCTKQNRAMLLRGTTPSEWEMVVLSDEHGSPAGQSLVIADGVLYYYTGTNFVRSGGDRVEIIPNCDNVRETLNSIPDAYKADVQGFVLPSRKWVAWTVRTDTGRVIVAYDYGMNAWSTHPDAPFATLRLLKSDQSEVVLASWYGEDILSEYLSGTDDDGGPLTCVWRSKAFGNAAAYHLVRGVRFLVSTPIPRGRGTATVRVINNADGTTIAERTSIPLSANGWQPMVTLPNAGQPATLQQIELEFSGTRQLKLAAVQIVGVELPRRFGGVL